MAGPWASRSGTTSRSSTISDTHKVKQDLHKSVWCMQSLPWFANIDRRNMIIMMYEVHHMLYDMNDDIWQHDLQTWARCDTTRRSVTLYCTPVPDSAVGRTVGFYHSKQIYPSTHLSVTSISVYQLTREQLYQYVLQICYIAPADLAQCARGALGWEPSSSLIHVCISLSLYIYVYIYI